MWARSSPSRVVGGRWLRQVRRASHSRRSKRHASSPLSRSASRHSGSAAERDPEQHARAELRRSSRLVNALPRSDYSITERWSYGADVYETRCEPSHHKGGDHFNSTSHPKRPRLSSYDKKRHSHPTKWIDTADECVAHFTRSRTALKLTESVCEPKQDSLKEQSLTNSSLNQNATVTLAQPNQTEGGLLPLDERDFAYSPFSSSTVTDLLDSDCSVYSPTASRRKGKKRKRSGHHSLSFRKSSSLLNFDECRKKLKIDSHSKEVAETSEQAAADSRPYRFDTDTAEHSSNASCTYLLRNRSNRDLGPPTSTVTADNTGNLQRNY